MKANKGFKTTKKHIYSPLERFSNLPCWNRFQKLNGKEVSCHGRTKKFIKAWGSNKRRRYLCGLLSVVWRMIPGDKSLEMRIGLERREEINEIIRDCGQVQQLKYFISSSVEVKWLSLISSHWLLTIFNLVVTWQNKWKINLKRFALIFRTKYILLFEEIGNSD